MVVGIDESEYEYEVNYTPNHIMSIVAAVLYLILGIIFPLINGYFMIDVNSGTKFFWGSIRYGYQTITFEQMAGIQPVGWGTIHVSLMQQLTYLGLAIWKYLYIILGFGGVILFVLPSIYYLLDKELPSNLDHRKIGYILALAGLVGEWFLFFLLWINIPAPKPVPSPTLVILAIIATFILYTGYKMEEFGEYWSMRLFDWLKATGFYMFVTAVIIYCVFPMIWSLIQSIQNPAFTKGYVEYIPSNPSFENYTLMFEIYDFQNFIINSFIISIATTLICVLIGAFGGYVLAKFQFKLKTLVLGLILSMTMFPGIIILIPLYIEYLILNDTLNIKLVNTLYGLLIPYTTFNLPLTLFLLYNFFQEIPDELVKAARVDGAGHFQTFQKIILPLAVPGVFTTAILVFIAAWNEYLFASVLISTTDKWTIPVAMSLFTGIPASGVQYNPTLVLNAATIVVTLPLIILVLIFQRQIISGITSGAVKG